MKSFVTFSALILAASAFPNVFERAACNRDDCLRQVVASSATPGSAQGSADCSSFFKKTLTPCPVTSTVTTTSTPIVSSTSTSTVSVTTTSTSVVSATSTSTMSTTSTSVVTSTITSTVTTISTASAGGAKKRAILEEVFDDLLPRAVAACTTLNSPSKIPAYASSCKSAAQYSSACSCDGISMTTTTLSPVTSTNTATVTASPSTTIVATSTQTTTFTSTEVDTTTLIDTITITATATSTSTVTVTTTTTSAYTPGPSCDVNAVFCYGGSSCVCYDRVSGGGQCATNGGGCGSACNVDSDCGSGYSCLTDCAANGYAGGCAQAAEDACRNSNAARSIFMKKRAGATLPLIVVPPSN